MPIPYFARLLATIVPTVAPAPIVEVLFSPRGGCTERAVLEISKATTAIRVQAYAFTSRPIADALMAAHGRGVDVRIILDRSMIYSKFSEGRDCEAAGIEVTYDRSHPIAHAKNILIDGKVTIGGSFNYSANASINSENMTIISSPTIADIFLANWDVHRIHAKPFDPKTDTKLGYSEDIVDMF